MKNLALCLVSVLATLAVVYMATDHDSVGSTKQAEYQSDYEEQQQLYRDQMEKAQAQSERVDRYYENAEKLQERYEAIIQRWEQQADRADAVLSKMEGK